MSSNIISFKKYTHSILVGLTLFRFNKLGMRNGFSCTSTLTDFKTGTYSIINYSLYNII